MNFIRSNEFFLLIEIIKKNFASKYKDSVFGILWSILRPLMEMIILTIIFSALFRNTISNYPVYILSGRCIFTFFTGMSFPVMNAIKGNKNILRVTSAPKYIFVIGSIFSEFINFIISLMLLVVIMIATSSPLYSTIPLGIIPIISLLIMITGIGLILSIVYVYFSDIKHLWSVITLMLMYASALFYPMNIIPEPFYSYLILNPLFWIVDQFRDFIMLGTIPDLLYIVNSYLISIIILVIGIIVFKKFESKAMKII